MDRYQIIERIGFDHDFPLSIDKFHDKETNKTLVGKTFDMTKSTESVPVPVIRKFSFWKEIDHENVARMVNIVIPDNRQYVAILFEYPDTTLKKFIEKSPETARDPKMIKRILHQILCGVSYYHSCGTPHGDLKPENILIDHSNGILKVADLGIQSSATYKAPEVLLKSSECSLASDMWSVGCIFAEMVLQETLFEGLHDELNDIFRLLGTPNEQNWPGVTKSIPRLDFYHSCPPQDLRAKFPSLESAGVNLLSKVLCLDPRKRITVQESLVHAYFNEVEGNHSFKNL